MSGIRALEGRGAGNREGRRGLAGTNAGGGIARARLGTSSRTKEKEEGKTELGAWVLGGDKLEPGMGGAQHSDTQSTIF